MFKQTYFPFDEVAASPIFSQSSDLLAGGNASKNTTLRLALGLALVAIIVFLYIERETLIFPLFKKQVKEESDLPHKVARSQSYLGRFE